jgi:hypothetical protein
MPRLATNRDRTDAVQYERADRQWLAEHQCPENCATECWVEAWWQEYDPSHWGVEWRLTVYDFSKGEVEALVWFCPFCGVRLPSQWTGTHWVD